MKILPMFSFAWFQGLLPAKDALPCQEVTTAETALLPLPTAASAQCDAVPCTAKIQLPDWADSLPDDMFDALDVVDEVGDRLELMYDIQGRCNPAPCIHHLRAFLELVPDWASLPMRYSTLLLRHVVWAGGRVRLSPHFQAVRRYLADRPVWPSGVPMNWKNAEEMAVPVQEVRKRNRSYGHPYLRRHPRQTSALI